MIPKIIHYCWLSGDPYPPLVEKCITSWKKYLPEYEFVLWNLERVDIHSNLWLEQAYDSKKYAFAADYIRFYALYHYGGIYLDADVEVFRSFDLLLNEQEFLGEEAGGDIEAAVMGAEKGLDWVKECLDYYHNRPFKKLDGTLDTRPVPLLVSKVVKDFKLKVRSFDYFSPKDFNIGNISISENTYCMHHFDGKWLKKGIRHKLKVRIHKLIYFFLGRKGHNQLVRLIRKLIN